MADAARFNWEDPLLLDSQLSDEERMKYKLFPKGMHPAPPLATIPEGTPEAIAKELKIEGLHEQ